MTAPRCAQLLKKDLEELLSKLIECGIADDQNFPIVRQVPTKGWEVSFDGAEHVSIVLGDIDYSEAHGELSKRRSYTAKLIDGGILQMMYLLEGERLIRHRLAYYPSPSLRPFQEDPEVYFRDELFLDIVSRQMVPFPLRFDFDEGAAKDVEHPRCHLTLGDIKSCRIPVSAPLTPRWFIEFVLHNFYQTEKHDFVTRLPDHRFCFPRSLTDNEARLIHVIVPQLSMVPILSGASTS
ncbi:MAG: DUF2290 domain-containing protein [Steroidobacteraceae bacterium]|nr:DUF2290 domain-containing protein [Steroidobacteraceae bacterium]